MQKRCYKNACPDHVLYQGNTFLCLQYTYLIYLSSTCVWNNGIFLRFNEILFIYFYFFYNFNSFTMHNIIPTKYFKRSINIHKS